MARYDRRIGPAEAGQGIGMALQSFAQQLQIAQERQKMQRENTFISDLSSKLITATDRETASTIAGEFMSKMGSYGVTDPSRPLALILQAMGSKPTRSSIEQEGLKKQETEAGIALTQKRTEQIQNEIDEQPTSELKIGHIVDLFRSTKDLIARKALLGKLEEITGLKIPLADVTGDESTDLLLSLVKTTANNNPEFANSAIAILRKDKRFENLPNIPINASKDKLDQIVKAVNLKALIAADPEGVDPTGNIGRAINETLTGLGVDTGEAGDASPAKTWYDGLTSEERNVVDAAIKEGRTLDVIYKASNPGK